jgi:phosphoglycerol transferase MdoB-like AlkP superfamily enzyme
LLAAAAPLVLWFAHLNLSYFLVPPSCGWGHRWGFGLVTVVALAGIGAASAASWRAWQADRSDATGGFLRLVGLSGVAFGALFALTTLLVGASALLVHPCH